MTNTTTPGESIGAPSGAASFYRWEVASKPIAVLFSLDLMDRLEREVLDGFKAVTKRGSEIGGVLGGRVITGGQPTVIIEQFEPVECDYSRGPLYLLSDEDKVRMKRAVERIAGSGVSVAGYFRSNTRRELVLDEEDQALCKEFFSDPNHVCLLVRPFAMKPSAGGFFFWENGQLPEASYLQFPFKRAELEKNFSQFIVSAPRPKLDERPAAPPAMAPAVQERPPAPTVAKREQRPRVVVKWEAKPVLAPASARRDALVPANPEDGPARKEDQTRTARAGVEPIRVMPIRVGRVKLGPVPAEPARAEAVRAEPREAELAEAAARKTEPREAEPAEVAPRRGQPVGATPLRGQPIATTPVPVVPVEPARAGAGEPPSPRLLSRLRWALVALMLALGAAGGYYFFVRPGGPAAGLAKVAEPSLGLTVDANAGHLLLSWNPNSPLVSAATRATLTIRDGDHQEDVDLDLATLREGSLVYTPISNDASFRLVVADQTTGRTTAESVRRLAGGPSQVVAAASFPHLRPEAARPAAATSEKPSSPPLEPTLAERRQQAPAPQVAAITVVTAQPAKENSLAARLSAATPIEIPAAPALDSQPDAFAGNAPNLPGASAAAPPPPVPAARQQPPKAAASAVPVAAPFPSLRIGGQAQQARLIKQFPAAYPATAKSWHITGNVRVLAVVGKSGRVRKATAISGPEILHSAAVGSVMKWIYSPAILNGEPVEAQTQVDVNFHTGM